MRHDGRPNRDLAPLLQLSLHQPNILSRASSHFMTHRLQIITSLLLFHNLRSSQVHQLPWLGSKPQKTNASVSSIDTTRFRKPGTVTSSGAESNIRGVAIQDTSPLQRFVTCCCSDGDALISSRHRNIGLQI